MNKADFKKGKPKQLGPPSGETHDRIPPHSLEAERGILGCMLLEPEKTTPIVVSKLQPEAFFHLPHRCIMETIASLMQTVGMVDIIILAETLKNTGEMEAVGGYAYLTSLQDAVPSAANLTYYLEIVQEKWQLRRLLKSCSEMVTKVYECETTPDALVAEHQEAVHKLTVKQDEKIYSASDVAKIGMESLEKSLAADDGLQGVATHIDALDDMLLGLKPGRLVVLAARPSVGKTSFAMNIVERESVDNGKNVAVFSLEMSVTELAEKMMCSRAGVSVRSFQNKMATQNEVLKVVNAAGQIGKAKMFIDDTAGINIAAIRARAMGLHAQHNLDLIVIDYFQLIQGIPGKSYDSRTELLGEVSNSCKILARDLKVPVVLLSQLNRELDKVDRKPTLADLRECGALEQDADIVLLMRRMKQEDDGAYNPVIKVTVDVAKHRGGPTGEVMTHFVGPITRFSNPPKIDPADMPNLPEDFESKP